MIEKKLRAIAVDDNPGVLQTIRQYADKTSAITLEECFTEALAGVAYLKNHPVDMVFLDIEMDDISGLDFIQLVQDQPISQPEFIIISAHEQYALKGFELNVVDYLHKPISYSRFIQALERTRQRLAPVQATETSPQTPEDSSPFSDYLFIHQGKKLVKIRKDTIRYIQSDGHYCYVHLANENRKHISYRLADLERSLADDGFLRVHKSYLINGLHIQELDNRTEGSQVQLDCGTEVPIGVTFRPLVQQFCQSFLRAN